MSLNKDGELNNRMGLTAFDGRQKKVKSIRSQKKSRKANKQLSINLPIATKIKQLTGLSLALAREL